MSTCLLTTTFALLGAHDACADRYCHLAKALGGVWQYGRTRAIPISRILAVNGLDDALWALRAVPPEQVAARDRLARLLACDYAEHVLPVWTALYPDDPRPADTIAVARRYARGEATAGELAAARRAACAAYDAAAYAAADAAADAAYAAWNAAGIAAGIAVRKAAERAWQTEQLRAALAGGPR